MNVTAPTLYRRLCVRIMVVPTLVFALGAAVPAVAGWRLLQQEAARTVKDRAHALWTGLSHASGKAATAREGDLPYEFRQVRPRTPGAVIADTYETQLVSAFDNDHKLKHIEGEIDRGGKRCYVIAAPIVVMPKGGGVKILGASVLYVPAADAYAAATDTYWVVCKMAGALALIGIVLLIGYVQASVVRPVGTLTETCHAIRRGEWAARFQPGACDEVDVLAVALQDTTFWLREQVAKEEKLRSMFQQFVPASVAARALGKDADKILAGTRQTVSVMVVNIRNFKLLMENLPPDQTVVVLNEFFSEVNKVIVANRGVVSKYLGDTVMAIFGMPVGNDTHALDAVTAALAIPPALQDLYVRLDEQHGWELGVGVGIATGEPIVGHFGSTEHREFTLLGDVVVEAHRMEKLTKATPEEDTVLINEATYRLVMSDVHVFDMDVKDVEGVLLHPYLVQGLRSEARRGLAA